MSGIRQIRRVSTIKDRLEIMRILPISPALYQELLAIINARYGRNVGGECSRRIHSAAIFTLFPGRHPTETERLYTALED